MKKIHSSDDNKKSGENSGSGGSEFRGSTATANPAQTRITIFDTDCEDTLNARVNCYACNKSGHVKRDCPVKTIAEDKGENIAAITAKRRGTWLKIAGVPRGIKDMMLP